MKIICSIGAVVLGFIAALALIVLTEYVTLNLHPFPTGVDTSDQTVISDHVANFPHWILAISAIAWLITAFVAAWIATRLGTDRHPTHGYVIGTILFLAAAFNMFLLPYPLWFKIVNFIGIPLVIFLGVALAKRPSLVSSEV